MAEVLAIDVTREHKTGVLGTKGDDKFPCQGKKITRVEFDKKVSAIDISVLGIPIPGTGQGNAFTSDTELPDVAVHYWADAGTKLEYSLKVWIET